MESTILFGKILCVCARTHMYICACTSTTINGKDIDFPLIF